MMNATATITIDLSNQTILLTGASGGIGCAVLSQLLRAGARVITTDINQESLEKNVADLITQYPGQVVCQQMDLADLSTIHTQTETWLQQWGPIDHLVSCAGLLHLHSLIDMPLTAIQQTFTVNVYGVVALMQAVGQSMMKQRRGSMVIIGSNAASTPRANIGAYAASKSALHMMVKCIGMELAPYGIRCNLVSPGSTRTQMQQQLWNDWYGEAQVIAGDASSFRLGIPLGKIAEPDDIAQTVLFLLSNAANHITLHDLRVDGGATLDH